MDILLVLPSFHGGGAETAYLRYIRHWPRGGDRFVVAVRSAEGPLFEAFSEVADIRVLGEGQRSGWTAALRTPVALARLIRSQRPAWVVGVLSPVSTAMAVFLSRRRSVRLALALQNPVRPEAGAPRWARPLIARAFRSADICLPIATGLAEELIQFGVPASRVRLLPNPVVIPDSANAREETKIESRPTIVSVARLHPQKRLDLALRVVAGIRVPGLRYVVLGEGPERTRLETLRDQLCLQDVVELPGFVSDPTPVLRDSDVFLLTSDFEGFGNVIIEALAVGLPVVSTDAPYGPRDILGQDERLGSLASVGDVEGLRAAVVSILGSRGTESSDLIEARLSRARDFEVGGLAHELAAYLH